MMTMTKYTTQVERYGRTESVVDAQAFARDLSKTLGGGALLPPHPNSLASEHHSFASFPMGLNIISVRANHYGSKGRVEVRISASDVAFDEFNRYAKTHDTQSATVDPEARTIERIAVDIKKRVIDASADALRLQREYASSIRANRDELGEDIKTLNASGYVATRRQGERDVKASVYSAGGHHYVSGYVTNGTVSIDHIGSMSVAKFLRVVAALNSKD
jgi:hypothetical protein